jgi:iron complex transport system permease protein
LEVCDVLAPDVRTNIIIPALARDASGTTASRRRRRIAIVYAVLIVTLVAVAASSLLCAGERQGSLSDVGLRSTLLAIRGSRLAAALLVGAALGVAGLVSQGLFRNPLADASVLGTSAGATLGGNTAILGLELLVSERTLRGVPPDVVLPIGCLFGALAALSILLVLLRRSGDVLSILLTGFLLSSLCLSLGSLLTSFAQERWELGRAVVSFTLGGLTGTGPLHIAMAAPLVVCGVGAAWFWAKPLDVLLSGDEEAASLGVDVGEVRRYCVLWVAALTAGAVALAGNLAFVGLLVPHALRPLLGVEHRRLVPVTALGGAVFVAACDLLARSLPSRGQIPLGVITGLVGAPVFLVLLLRLQRGTTHG